MIPQSDIDNAAAGYGIGASNLTWKTPESQARIAFKAGCEWAMGKIRANRDNPVKPKERANAVKPIKSRALVRLGDKNCWHSNDYMPATILTRPDGKWEVTWDHGVRPGHHWSAIAFPDAFKVAPFIESDWVEMAIDEIFDKCVCSGDGQLFASNQEIAAIIRKHAPITPMPADYDDCPKGGGGE